MPVPQVMLRGYLCGLVAVAALAACSGPPSDSFIGSQVAEAPQTLPSDAAQPEPATLEAYPTFRPQWNLSGTLSAVGSDSMSNLMALWSEAYRDAHPGVRVQVQSAGSATAPPALIQGVADLGPMSRLMTADELERFTSRYGYAPQAVPVALDALAIYVHRDNPLQALDLRQLDAIFGRNYRCGGPGGISQWQALVEGGRLPTGALILYGRNSASGTHAYFRSAALCGGDFLARVNEQPGSASVVQAVGASILAMGYSSAGYQTPGVRALRLRREDESTAVAPLPKHILSGAYPLSRTLYIYLNMPPNRDLSPVVADFLRMVLSDVGQGVVRKDGYVPLPVSRVQRLRAFLGVEASAP